MKQINVSYIMAIFLFPTIGLLFLVSCGGETKTGPEKIVEQVFSAYQEGNGNAINDLMSEQGRVNASVLCDGSVINCLNVNYRNAGELQDSRVEVKTQNENSADVILYTSWSDGGEFCQVYNLDKTDNGWRITFFDEPKSNCSDN